tara:strand:+ start:1156 stop:1680 length:525 start_codon:yes stop_codon:yes gene_type:complete
MATGNPEARRVIFSSYVIPTHSIEGEEASVRHTEFQASPKKALSGKGIATINKDQWGDGWTSFNHQGAYWEDMSDDWDLLGELWSGLLEIGTSPIQLTEDTSHLAFLYIKNFGASRVIVSLNGNGGNYYIAIPVNGSVHLRGADGLSDATNLGCDEVFVKSSGKATIEWIIAKG